jgi:hypothetical protein
MAYMTRFARLVRALIGAAAVLSAACESPSAPHHPGAADVPVRITAVTVGTPISILVVEVSASDLPGTLVFNLGVMNGVASGTIKIPPGAARTIHVTAVDDQGDVTHEGSATIDVRPGQNPPVQIKLAPKSGQVPISVTFGNFGVVVTPPQATIDLSSSQQPQVQLAVTVTDVNGQVIAAPQVGWATTQPAVAMVTGSGLVTGLIDGSATIVATYEGVAGLSAITVSTGVSPEICDGVDNDHNGSIDELPYCHAGNGDWSLSPAITTTCTGTLVNAFPLLAKPTLDKVTTRVGPRIISLQFDLAGQAFTVLDTFDAVTGVFTGGGTSVGQVIGTATISGTFTSSDAFTMNVRLVGITASSNGLTATCGDIDQAVSGSRIVN